MQLSEKIQKLRKERGLTQEQFAAQLFVSRTAVSKWETGRGMPGMESLQMIARLCGVSLDQLLDVEEVLVAAEQENRETLDRFAFSMDGLFGIGAVISLVLPLYKLKIGDSFHSVALYQFTGWLGGLYWFFPLAMALCGLIQVLIRRSESRSWKNAVSMAGLLFHVCAVFLLILGGQPYPAVLFFGLLLIRGAVMLLKGH